MSVEHCALLRMHAKLQVIMQASVKCFDQEAIMRFGTPV